VMRTEHASEGENERARDEQPDNGSHCISSARILREI